MKTLLLSLRRFWFLSFFFLMIWTDYPENNLTSFPAGAWLLSLRGCEFNAAVVKNRHCEAPLAPREEGGKPSGGRRCWSLTTLILESGTLSTGALRLGAEMFKQTASATAAGPLNREDIHLPRISCALIEQNSLPAGKPK